jgi:hypothetical protein
VACHSATLRQPAPSPVLHLLWLGTPPPNLPARAPAADAFTEEPLKNRTADTAHCNLLNYHFVLLAAAPEHCGPPGPAVSPVAVLQPLWLRNSTTAPPYNCATAARQFISARPLSISVTRETITTPTTQCLLQPTQIFACPTVRQSPSNGPGAGVARSGRHHPSRRRWCLSALRARTSSGFADGQCDWRSEGQGERQSRDRSSRDRRRGLPGSLDPVCRTL